MSIRGWLKPSLKKESVVCKSSLVSVHLHWVEQLPANVRCAGAGCAICEAGHLAKWHEVCVVDSATQGIRLLELSEEHLPLRARLRALGPDLCGVVLHVQRTPEVESTLSVEVDEERIQTRPIPCTRYIQAIGLKKYDAAVQLGLFG